MRKDGKHSEEAVLRAEEAYLNNPGLTLDKLSEQSEQVIGEFIPADKIKRWSMERGWSAKRGRAALPLEEDDVAEEVRQLRKAIYRQIVAESESGLMLSGEFDVGSVENILADVDGVTVTRISPRGIDAALVNAYKGLLQISNVDLSDAGKSGKTERQQGIEVAKEAIKGARG
jgi:hypothetical protein